MPKLKKYDVEGKETGEISVEDSMLQFSANAQMIKDYLVAIRKNARQWSANTKGRSEIRSTKTKPHPQKGLGRARQGAISAPQYRGGGIVFGPKPKFNQHVRINKKERKAAISSLLTEKIKANKVCILEKPDLKQPKTKTIVDFIKKLEMEKKRILFIGHKQENSLDTHFIRSMRNIPKAEFVQALNVNGYVLTLSEHLVVLDEAVDVLLNFLKQ